jgi:hypothetical protein
LALQHWFLGPGISGRNQSTTVNPASFAMRDKLVKPIVA